MSAHHATPPTPRHSNCDICCCREGAHAHTHTHTQSTECPLSLNMAGEKKEIQKKKITSGCVESINAHSLQTSQSHVLVACMVSPADSENNPIIIILSGSGSSAWTGAPELYCMEIVVWHDDLYLCQQKSFMVPFMFQTASPEQSLTGDVERRTTVRTDNHTSLSEN